ncbi:hypothetical protein ACQP0C_02485 [Nocardia sp. CA-129566]|uniref:hypothetical protein n=1 Tax=Nocardia sp. CA-129566 TaxID=3239976 RepID=UPI003D95BEB3
MDDRRAVGQLEGLLPPSGNTTGKCGRLEKWCRRARAGRRSPLRRSSTPNGAGRRHRPRGKPQLRRWQEDQRPANGHIAVDTNGLLLAVVVTMAPIRDRDVAVRLLTALRAAFATITMA